MTRATRSECCWQHVTHRRIVTAWSSLVHAPLMGAQAFLSLIARGELVGVAALIVIGGALIILTPTKQPAERASAVGA